MHSQQQQPQPDAALSGDGPLPTSRASAATIRDERLQALAEFARCVVHDFNNALSPVLGYSDLLREQPDIVGGSRDLVDRLEQGALRAAEILRELELFSSETPRGAVVEVPLASIVRGLVETAESSGADRIEATFRGQLVHLDLDDSLLVTADPDEIRKLVGQLLTNAAEASSPRQAIEIRWFRQGAMAKLQVIDVGIGMSPELCAKCHEPLQTTKTVIGAGLGLSSCLGIVRRSRGTLQIDSKLGHGTIVSVVLPTVAGKED